MYPTFLPHAGISLALDTCKIAQENAWQDAEKVRQRRSRIAQRLNVEENFLEIGNTGGAYPFTKIHLKGERPTRSAVRTSSPLCSLRPCWTAFLSILRLF
jgi:hypothetical protein